MALVVGAPLPPLPAACGGKCPHCPPPPPPPPPPVPTPMLNGYQLELSTDVTGRRVWVPRARHEKPLHRVGKGRRIKHVFIWTYGQGVCLASHQHNIITCKLLYMQP